MNIWMFVKNNFKHDARVYKEARTLIEEGGHEVTVLALKDEDSESFQIWDGIRVIRLSIDPLPLPRIFKYSIPYLKGVMREVFKERADVYHSHDLNTLVVGYLASRFHRAKLVYDSHELWIDRNAVNEPAFDKWRSDLTEKLLIKRADVVITTNDARAKILSERYGIPLPVVVRNCPSWIGQERTRIIRDKLGLENGIKIVLYQGALAPNRGLEQLMEAVAYLENAVIVMMGYGIAEEELKARAKELGLEDKVKFLDAVPLEQLPAYTASADVGVAPIQNSCLSYYYSAPNKLFEYLHSGLPVAVSDFPEMGRIVREHQVGRLFDQTDPRSIAQAIDDILGDEEKYKQMRANALEISANIFNWEREAEKLLEVYRNFGN